MQFTLQQGLSVDAILSSLPRNLRAHLPCDLPKSQYTLVRFRGDQRHVVTSNVVTAALAKIPPKDSEGIIAVGSCFTWEAQELLRKRNAIIIQQDEWDVVLWTDESYTSIRERR